MSCAGTAPRARHSIFILKKNQMGQSHRCRDTGAGYPLDNAWPRGLWSRPGHQHQITWRQPPGQFDAESLIGREWRPVSLTSVGTAGGRSTCHPSSDDRSRLVRPVSTNSCLMRHPPGRVTRSKAQRSKAKVRGLSEGFLKHSRGTGGYMLLTIFTCLYMITGGAAPEDA